MSRRDLPEDSRRLTADLLRQERKALGHPLLAEVADGITVVLAVIVIVGTILSLSY